MHADDVPEADRADYLLVVASLVAADDTIDDAELAPLEALCRELQVSDEVRAKVLASARDPDAAAVDAALQRLARDGGLGVALLTDAIAIVFADGRVAPGESEALRRIGRALHVGVGQLAMIGRYVESVVLGKPEGMSRELADGIAREPGAVRGLYKLFKR